MPKQVMQRVTPISENTGPSLGRLLFFFTFLFFFRAFCLVVKRNFVYLHIVKDADVISHPGPIISKEV